LDLVFSFSSARGSFDGMRFFAVLPLLFVFGVSSISASAAISRGARIYGVFGDGGAFTREAESVLESMQREGIHDLALLGDNAYPGWSYEAAWSPWMDAGFRFPVVALGNHHNGYENEMAFFNLRYEYYAKELAPGVLAVVLNSDREDNAEEQAAYLEEVFQTSDAESIFILFHHPMLSLTKNHPWTERALFHQAVRPVIQRYRHRISAVLNGHDHLASAFSFDSLPVLVSGAVKEVMAYDPVYGKQESIEVKTEWAYRPRPTWLRLAVVPYSADSRIDFVDAQSSRPTCTIQIRTGEWIYLEENCYRKRR
jgi:hypothetical protein